MDDKPANPSDSQSEAELHTASDQNRVEFLRTELATCFTFADMAAYEKQAGEPDHAANSLAHAETGYATMIRFLSDPKHSKHLTQEQSLELSVGVERLRARLDELAKSR